MIIVMTGHKLIVTAHQIPWDVHLSWQDILPEVQSQVNSLSYVFLIKEPS